MINSDHSMYTETGQVQLIKGRSSRLLFALIAILVVPVACKPDRPPSLAAGELPALHLPGGGWLGGHPSGRSKALGLELAVRLERARKSGTPEGLRLSAVLAASRGRWDAANLLLQRAAKMGLPASLVATDQAAIALAAAATGEDPLGRVTALAKTEEAILADPRSVAAWHNRALTLEQLQLTSSAKVAWQRFLEVAPESSSWVDQAKRQYRLAADNGAASCWQATSRWRQWLAAPRPDGEPALTEQRNAQALRMFVEDELLPAWAHALLSGEAGKAQILKHAGLRLARVVKAATGDGMTLEIFSRAVDARAQGARALLAYQEGRVMFRTIRYEQGAQQLDEAARLLAATGNPLALRARAYRAACLARVASEATAESDFLELKTSSYSVVRAHASEQLGSLYSRRGLPEKALPEFREAASLLAAHNELTSLAVVEGWIADTLYTLGDLEKSWQAMERALRTANRSCSTYARDTSVWLGGDLLLRAGALLPALSFQRESLALERANGDPTLIVESLRTIALNEARLHQPDRAVATIEEARALVGKIPSRSVQEAEMGFLDWAEGTAIIDRNPGRAADLLSRALASLKRSGRESERTAVLLELGRSLLATGDRERGRKELRRGIDAHERLREHVASLNDPARAFAEAEPAFDALTQSLLADGLVEEALINAERARRPLAGGGVLRPPKGAPVSTTGVLYLDQMEDRLVAWWIMSGRVRFWETAWRRQTTREKVAELLAHLREEDDGALRRFSADLLAPIIGDLRSLDRVVVIVEDALAVVPWSALPDPRGGQWIDHLVVTLAPSLEVALRPRRAEAPQGVLVVADAEPDPKLRLPPLPAARLEGESIAALYPQATLLLGDRATRPEVLSHWASADVIHFAVHAMIDDTFLKSARLVLSSSGNGFANVTTADVAGTHFDRHPLVVLSACATRAGRVVPLAGPMDLARELLASGASGVIATLIPVDDRRSADLMIAFHQQLAESGDAAAALARASRMMRQRGSSEIRDWAAFQYIGADPSVGASLPSSLTRSP